MQTISLLVRCTVSLHASLYQGRTPSYKGRTECMPLFLGLCMHEESCAQQLAGTNPMGQHLGYLLPATVCVCVCVCTALMLLAF